MRYMTLCRPYMEGLKAAGQRLAELDSKTKKGTCEACGRRRFTLRYSTERSEDHAKSKSRITAAEASG